MLIFRRVLHERIILDFTNLCDADLQRLRAGEVIEVQVTEVCGHEAVKLGVRAPLSVRVDREEVALDRKMRPRVEEALKKAV